jgi:hypothetical protein
MNLMNLEKLELSSGRILRPPRNLSLRGVQRRGKPLEFFGNQA